MDGPHFLSSFPFLIPDSRSRIPLLDYDYRRLFSERWETFGLEVSVDLVDMVHELSLEVIPHLRLMFYDSSQDVSFGLT